ncbi:hypothetical protein [Virgibacillus sp. MG-45]|uniref:hypothetical protein n=1 Tax=Virgibacillus sp. MG-45 TaxID=3102791 RepID=UPI002ED9228A
MEIFILTSVIVYLGMIGIGIILRKKRAIFTFILPLIGVFFSLVLFGISFSIGSWEGMIIGLFGVFIFVGSILAILTFLIWLAIQHVRNK